MAVVISDASPLVHLSAISKFHLLKELYPELVIPKAVWDETVTAGRGRPGSADLTTAVTEGWIRLETANLTTLANPELRGLDLGESEALALAIDLHAEAVLLDEIRGRAAARRLGLRAVGTLGVLIQAKRAGFINNFKEALADLRAKSQLQLSPEIETEALRQAGEYDAKA